MEGWEIRTIDEVCNVINGGTPKTKVAKYWNGPHAWITPAEMGNLASPYIERTRRTLTDEGLHNCSATLLPPYSVILSSRAPIGHLAINTAPMGTNQGCKGLVPSEQIDYRYLYYFLNANVDLLNQLGTGATFKELSAAKLKNVPIPLPPLPTQRRIVAILDEAFAAIDRAIGNVERNLGNVGELWESYLEGLFTAANREWMEVRFGDDRFVKIIDGDRGINYPKKSDFANEGYCLFLNTKNVRQDGFTFDTNQFISKERCDSLRKGKLQRRDVVLTTRGTIGNIGIYNDSVNYNNIRINSGMLILRPNEDLIISEYLFEALRSGYVKRQIEQYTSGAAQPQLPIRTLSKLTIPVPNSIERQRGIVKALEAVYERSKILVDLYGVKENELSSLKQSLLHQAFTGRLTTEREVEEEMAGV